VIHYNSSSDHVDYSWLVGVEWQRANRWLVGFSYFNNSFGQKSQYLYGGKSWTLDSISRNLYFKLTGGIVAGYKEPHENALPINYHGVGPVIIPGIGYKYERFNMQLNLLGAAGLMVTVGYDVLR